MEYATLILECSLVCERTDVDPILVFPEDLGGREHHGPASVWQLREFQVLECDHDARRGAGFLCQLAHAEQKRPLGILTILAALHADLCMGWPKFVLIQNDLRYVGPLPQRRDGLWMPCSALTYGWSQYEVVGEYETCRYASHPPGARLPGRCQTAHARRLLHW